MKCEQCTSLQEPVVDSLPILSSDIPQWLQSNGNPTLVKSSENDQSMDGSPVCECGKETFGCLIHPNTPEKWIASMQDSLVRILALLENKPVLGKEPDRGFTEKSCELLAQLDHDSYSWKMSPLLKATDLRKLSKTWPSWGMTVDGCAYAHPMSGHRITETGGLHWPTPTVQDSNKATKKWRENPQNNLTAAVFNPIRMFPTPTTRDYKGGGYRTESLIRKDGKSRAMDSLPNAVLNGMGVETTNGGQLNPTWVEWLMGWPIGHTGSKHWEMVKSLSKSQSHLPSWLKDSHANP